MYQILTSCKTRALRGKHRAEIAGCLWAGFGQHVVQRISILGSQEQKGCRNIQQLTNVTSLLKVRHVYHKLISTSFRHGQKRQATDWRLRL